MFSFLELKHELSEISFMQQSGCDWGYELRRENSTSRFPHIVTRFKIFLLQELSLVSLDHLHYLITQISPTVIYLYFMEVSVFKATQEGRASMLAGKFYRINLCHGNDVSLPLLYSRQYTNAILIYENSTTESCEPPKIGFMGRIL